MIIKEFERGPVFTFSYVVTDEQTRGSIIIDVPFESADDIIPYVSANDLVIRAIVLTHGHWDHVGDVNLLKKKISARVLFHPLEEPLIKEPMGFIFPPPIQIEGTAADQYLDEGDMISVGNLQFKILHVPGHTPGHVALFEQTTNSLFAGDVLFQGSIGRTDFPGGDYETLMNSIQNKILTLPSTTRVYPGHGPNTTIETECKYNPFIIEYLQR